ncbi:sulfite exporter TauE/SafE family protein [Acidobacteriota bacterium]
MKFFQKMIQKENYFVFLLIPIFWLFLLPTFQHDFSCWVRYWWMFPVAFLISTTVNTVGISGAALFVPFFVIIFPLIAPRLLPEQSVKLGLITESFGLSSSVLAFIRFELVDKKLGLYTVLGASPFVIGGAFLSFYLLKFLFYFLISAALILSVVILLNKERKKSKKTCLDKEIIGNHHTHPRQDNVTIVDKDGKKYQYCRCGYRQRFMGYGFGGIFQGLAGFGIGEIGITSMVLTQIPIRIAIGTSHIVVAFTAILASLTHVSQSAVHNIETPWNILFMTVPAVIFGGQLAPYVASKLKTSTLEHFVSGLFAILALALLYLGLKGL